MTEDQFEAAYESINAPDGSMIWDWAEVKGIPLNRVWTVVDGEDGGLWAMPGFHLVNRVGYLVTVKPWEREDLDVQLDMLAD